MNPVRPLPLALVLLLLVVTGLLACSGAPVNLVEEPPPDASPDTFSCPHCDRVPHDASHDAGRDRVLGEASPDGATVDSGHEPTPEAAPPSDVAVVDAGADADPVDADTPDTDPPDVDDAGAPDACCDAGPDSGKDAGPADAGHDAGFDAGWDAGHDAGHDAGFDAGKPDTGAPDAKSDVHDAGPPPPVDAGCTERPKGSHACGYYTATTPADFCVEFGGTGIAVATPAACTCVSTYTCACLYANGIDTTSFCGGFYPSSCTDSPQGPFVVCP